MRTLTTKDVFPLIIVLTFLTFLTLTTLSQTMAGFRSFSGAIESRSINTGAQDPRGMFQEVVAPGSRQSADKQGPACESVKKKDCDMMDMMDETDHEAMMNNGKWQDIKKAHKNMEGFDHGPMNQGTRGTELKQTL